MSNENGMGSGERYQLLRPYLSGTERVLWSGNPCTTRKRKIDIGKLVFALCWNGGVWFLMITAFLSVGPVGLFSIPFVCVGLLMLYQEFIAPKRKFPRVVYAVTDIRAIILIPSRKGYSVTSYLFHSLQGMSLADMKDKSGTIVFPSAGATADDGSSASWVADLLAVPNDRFLLIDGVNEVYTLILNQIKVQDWNV